MCANNWNEARRMIREKVNVGDDLNTDRSTWRIVLDKANWGYRVKIGKSNDIKIKWGDLEALWNKLHSTGKYNRDSFENNFPSHWNGHKCGLGVVGEIFVRAGLAQKVYNCHENLEYRENAC